MFIFGLMDNIKTGILFRSKVLAIWCLLAILVIALAFARMPGSYDFTEFAFHDVGGNLAIHRLVQLGYYPMSDFYYPYGLLSLLISQVWFTLFGASAASYCLLLFCCNLLVALGIARYIVVLQVETVGIALIILALPHIIGTIYPKYRTKKLFEIA